MTPYVVATSQKEANEVAAQIGHRDKSSAEQHLREVKAPPTDPFYAAHYRVYRVEVPNDR